MSETIAIVAMGDMGHAVGGALRVHGHDVVTDLSGRSARSRALADAGGVRDAGSLDAAIDAADLFLSIAPPAAASDIAAQVAAAMLRTGKRIPFADCNAVSPATVKSVASQIVEAGAPFIDASIIGLAPGKQVTRFYASGPQAEALRVLDGKGMKVTVLSDRIGDASALKMCFASITKGTNALYAAALVTAARLGQFDALKNELTNNAPHVWQAMGRSVPWLAADAERWVREMEEIAATYTSAGMPDGFHEGAAALFRHLSTTPFAEETRETLDRDRTLEQTIETLARR